MAEVRARRIQNNTKRPEISGLQPEPFPRIRRCASLSIDIYATTRDFAVIRLLPQSGNLISSFALPSGAFFSHSG
jgi:hypothetical protein